MYCKKCGKQLKDGARFCSSCGQAVTPVSQEAVPEKQLGNRQKVEEKKPFPIWIPILVCVIVAAAALAVGAALGMRSRPSQQESIQKEEQEEERRNEPEETQEKAAVMEEEEEESETEKEQSETEKEQSETEKEESETEKEGQKAEAEETSDMAQQHSGPKSQLAQQIHSLNTEAGALPSIDIDAENYQPAQRDYDAAWDMMLFYTLEDVNPDNEADGKINGYNIRKKELINVDSGRTVEYNIYTNPQSAVINKIVSIEQDGAQLLVREYYYTDEGKINFIFDYKDTNYFPSYATPNRDGERFYFDKDRLTKWRVVSGGEQTNYVIGANAAEAGANAGAVILYSELDAATQSSYDAKEKAMINAAYNTYATVKASEGINVIQGYVYDKDGSGLNQAEVAIYPKDEKEAAYQTSTNADGWYQIYVPSRTYSYELKFTKDQYTETVLYNLAVDEQNIGNYQPSVYLMEGDQEYDMTIRLCDALNYNISGDGMIPLDAAEYVIRRGINCTQGDAVSEGISDGSGMIYVTLPVGMYTVQVTKTGYDTSYFILTVRSAEETQYNISPKLQAGEMRIVLTWGQSPSDLDSHLFTPYCTAEEHISFYHSADTQGNSLDVDVVTGYGPETVTISNLDMQGLYKYYVADFTNCSYGNFNSMDMSMSNATVNVYTQDGLIATFYVPTNCQGVIWEVFEIRNGVLVPSQRYYEAVEDKDWWSAKY